MAQSLKLPDFSANKDTWGPSEKDDLPFNDLPFVPFTKRDPVNYIADFTPSFFYGAPRRGRTQRERTGDDQAILGNFSDNETEFQGTAIRTKKYDETKYGRKDWSAHRTKMAEAHERLQEKERQRIENAPKSKFGPKQQIMKKKRRKKLYENPRPTVVSIKKSDAWQLMTDLWFNSMLEITMRPPSEYDGLIDTIATAGTIASVRNEFDAIRCRTPAELMAKKYTDSKYVHFDYVSASNDPIFAGLIQKMNKKTIKNYKIKLSKGEKTNNNNNFDDSGNKWKVFTTDTIMALLMCIVRSKYSFDVVITKVGKFIFLDQRNKSNNYWHVDETSQNRPTKKGTAPMNKYTKLAVEATYINRVLSEQLVSHKNENRINLARKHPFAESLANDSDRTTASTAFVYKTFDLRAPPNNENEDGTGTGTGGAGSGGSGLNSGDTESKSYGNEDIRIYARCSIHGFDKEKSGNNGKDLHYVNIFGLNQYDNLKSKTADWNKELDQQVAGIILTEIANNAFKIARMTVQSYLGGADTMKLGFITRAKITSDSEHNIVGVKTIDTREMLRKCNIQLKHEWGILRHIINIIKQFDDGRFIAVRDPLKQVIRFYRVEPNAFGKDDELQSFKDIKKTVDISQYLNQSQSQDSNKNDAAATADKQSDQ